MPALPRALAGLVVWLALGPAVAVADNPVPSGPATSTTEFNILPLVGGDSDIGLGFGELSNLAGIAPAVEPFRWELESSGFISFKPRDGGVVIPYQDYFIVLHLPNLGAHHLWLDLRAAYTDEATIKFYGIGNASPVPSPRLALEDTEYKRMHPTLSAEGRMPVYRDVYINGGSVFTYNRLTVRPTSILGQYATAGPADARPFVGAFDNHAVELLELGVQYDTRDHQIDTRNGQFDAAQIRVSPRLGSVMPYGYERITLTGRYYKSVTDRITLTARIVGDTLLGDPPFYELARYEETPAIGGVNTIRGVPAGRYYGRVKLFGNVEARSDLFGFHLWGKPLKLGVAAFFDGGRSWTELWHSHPELDGTGIGLKYGIGGGLRLQQGSTFVVRADLAYSPDATPVGAYFTAGQIF
ncbi:MAG TPA: BamA/TamA family outer membrane protein [Kofleriaceae bacterium]|nr:BamA/TamA family outer membrane protein [Kofleriaceae bacterium]